MPDANTMRRITAYVAGSAALLTALALLLGGSQLALGAAAGGAYATLNWLAMRWVGARLMGASERGRAFYGLVLGSKMLLAMLVVWAILATGAIDPVGFVLGLGGLVLGILGGTLHGFAEGQGARGEEA